MTISEATALARARAARAAFPKGKITTTQARAMFVSIMDSLVGYASGNPNWSMFGKGDTWRTSWGGRQVYWCVLTGSFAADFAFGHAAALAGFGVQYPGNGYPPVGGTWTVWVYDWGRANGRIVPIDSVQSGDIVLTRWGRTGAVVDHYDVATGPRSLNVIPVIGGNTSTSSASAGAGVYRALRPRNRVVAVVRPDWAALVATYNSTLVIEELIDWTTIHRLLLDLGYTADTSGVRAFQRDHGLTVDGIPGSITTAALEDIMSQVLDELRAIKAELQDHRGRLSQLHERQSNLGQSNNNVNRNLSELIGKIPAAVAGYRNPGYPQRDTHGLWRDAATVKQGLRELATALRQSGNITAAGEATVQAATEDDTEQEEA